MSLSSDAPRTPTNSTLHAHTHADNRLTFTFREKSIGLGTVKMEMEERIGVRAQSILGGKTFLPENICTKINKIPEIYMTFDRKN